MSERMIVGNVVWEKTENGWKAEEPQYGCRLYVSWRYDVDPDNPWKYTIEPCNPQTVLSLSLHTDNRFTAMSRAISLALAIERGQDGEDDGDE